MIAFATPSGLDDLLPRARARKLEQFVDAVARGHTLFACPSVTKRMNEEFKKHNLDFTVTGCAFLDEGNIYAVNSKFEFDLMMAIR